MYIKYQLYKEMYKKTSSFSIFFIKEQISYSLSKKGQCTFKLNLKDNFNKRQNVF